MARKANDQKLESLKREILKNPGKQPGFFARLLGWRREEVSRALASMNDQGTLLWEDERGGLHPFKRSRDSDD